MKASLVTVIAFLSFLGKLQAAVSYSVVDLGTLGGTASYGAAINASGEVTGTANLPGDKVSHAFLYDGQMHDLGSLGSTSSGGNSITSDGRIAGWYYTNPGSTLTHAFLYDGAMHDLGTLGGSQSYATGINDMGQITGYSTTVFDSFQRAFLYDGTMHSIGTLGGSDSYGNGINNKGQITGYSFTTFDQYQQAFIYDTGTQTMRGIGTLGGNNSEALAVNNFGQAVGDADTLPNTIYFQAFLYDDQTGMKALGPTTGPDYGGVAVGINNLGQVVGFDAHRSAFLYTESDGLVELNTLIDPTSGWDLTNATSINDSGEIAGTGLIDGETRAFLLIPVPEPNTIELIAIGVAIHAVYTVMSRGPNGFLKCNLVA